MSCLKSRAARGMGQLGSYRMVSTFLFLMLITNGGWVRGREREGGDDDIQMVGRRRVTECERGAYAPGEE